MWAGLAIFVLIWIVAFVWTGKYEYELRHPLARKKTWGQIARQFIDQHRSKRGNG